METTTSRSVIVVHQQSDARKGLGDLFASTGYRVRTHGSIQSFLNALPEMTPTCVVVGLPMHRSDSQQFLDALNRVATEAPVVLVTTCRMTAPGMRAAAAGKFPVIDPSVEPAQLLLAVKRAFADHEARGPTNR